MNASPPARIRYDVVDLPLRRTFAISRGSLDVQQSVIVTLDDGQHVGRGEAPRSHYYGQPIDRITSALDQIIDAYKIIDFVHPWRLHHQLSTRFPGESFAISAIDQAAHDLAARRLGQPLHQSLGLDWGDVPETSITLSMGDPDSVLLQLAEYAHWPIVKVKLGSPHDERSLRAIRGASDAIIRVDANGAWTVDQTIANSRWLADLGVEFIEQPLPATASLSDRLAVATRSCLPIIADESCVVESDVARCVGMFAGVNIKLCKCGGITPAVRMLRQARRLGIKTMLGCMIESDVGIAAASHLLPLLDYADLDGSTLLQPNSYAGVTIHRWQVSKTGWPRQRRH